MNEEQRREFKSGWMIIMAAVLQYVFGYPATILPMSSILFGPKYKEFKTSETEKAVMVGLFTVFMNIVSIFVGPMVKARSSRFVAILATSCQVLGLVICAFSNCTALIIIGFGMFVGTGVGLSFVNNIIIVTKYFPKSTGIAFGTALSCICLIGLVIPLIMEILIDYFEQKNDLLNQWTTLVYAGMSCVGFNGAILMIPKPGILVPDNEETVPEDVEDDHEDSEYIQACKEFLLLLKDPVYIVTAVVNSCCFAIMVYFISLLAPIATSRKLNDQSSNLVTIFIATNAFVLLPMGLLGDSTFLKNHFKFPKKSLYIFCCSGLVITIGFLNFTRSFITLIIGTVLSAIFTSGMFITTNLVYYECFPSMFESAVGLSNLFRCIFALSINPLAGYLTTLPGCQDLSCSLHFLSGTTFILIVIWVGLGLMAWRPNILCVRRIHDIS